MSRHFFLAVLLFSLVPPVAAEAPPEAYRSYSFHVDVDDQGRVTAAQPVGEIPAALLPTVRALAEGAEFEPARIGDRPVPSRTLVKVRMRFQSGDDELRVEPVEISGGGGRLENSFPPRYPFESLRADIGALVWSYLSFNPDGSLDLAASRVESVDVVRGRGNPNSRERDNHTRRFEAAVLAAAANWTFVPDEVDGQPLAMSVRVPTRFCPSSQASRCADFWTGRYGPEPPAPTPTPMDSAVTLVALKPAAPVAGGG